MKNLFLMLLCIFLVLSCGRSSDNETSTSQDQLPAATQTGANTAGCNVNGQVLIPKNGAQSIGGQPLYGLKELFGNNFYPLKDDYWQLEISNKKDSNGMSIFLWIKTMKTSIGTYVVNQSNGQLYDDGPNNNQIILISADGKTFLSSANSGSIKILRADVSSSVNIISGSFSAELYNRDKPSEMIKITDGRFDIDYTTLNK